MIINRLGQFPKFYLEGQDIIQRINLRSTSMDEIEILIGSIIHNDINSFGEKEAC